MFNLQTNQDVFNNEIKVSVYFFHSKSSRNFAQDLIEFKQAATEFRGKVIFVLVDEDQTGKSKTAYDFLADEKTETTFLHTVLRFFGIKRYVLPRVHLVSIISGKPILYRLELNETETLTSDSLVQFTNDFFNSEIKPYVKTEKIPADWDAKPVKTLVGKNIDQIARDRKKAVLVQFCNFNFVLLITL